MLSSAVQSFLMLDGLGIERLCLSTLVEEAIYLQLIKYPLECERGTCRWTLTTMHWKFLHKRVDWRRYFAQANEDTMAIPLIEDEEGIRNLDEILSVKGLDFIFLGPGDLCMSLGCFGDYESEAVKRNIEKAVALFRERKIPVASLAARYGLAIDREHAEKLIEMGIKILIFMDIGISEEGCQVVEAVRQIQNSISEY